MSEGPVTPEELLQAQTAMDQMKALSCDFGRMAGDVFANAVEHGASEAVAARTAEIWASGLANAAFPRRNISLFGDRNG